MNDESNLRVLAEATIQKATRFAIYPTGDDGLPSDPDQRAAWDDAIDAQVSTWRDAGLASAILTRGANSDARIASTANQGASLSYDYSKADAGTTYLLDGGLSPLAEAHLFKAGLMGNLPGVWR